MASTAYLVLVVVIAAAAPIALPEVSHQQAGDLSAVLEGPSMTHVLGTDSLGRDVAERLLVGTTPTVLGVLEALLVAVLIAIPTGLLAAYSGGRSDRMIVWLGDLLFSIPGIVLVLAVVSVFRQSMLAAMITLGILGVPPVMRIVRSAALTIRATPYVDSAKVSGLSSVYIMRRHLLPRIAGPIAVQVSLLAGVILLIQTGLGFLGLIVAEPAPSWGSMVADGMTSLSRQPWLIFPPGITIAITVLALGLLGDAFRDSATEGWSGSGLNGPTFTQTKIAQDCDDRPLAGAESVAHPPDAVISIRNLSVSFMSSQGSRVLALDDIGIHVGKGHTLGLVGESGCGKSTLAMAILGTLPSTAKVEHGSIRFRGDELLGMNDEHLNRYRGSAIGYVSQQPMVSLNPAFRVGWQLAEAVRLHQGVSGSNAKKAARTLLDQVRLPRAHEIAECFPHELSGGMAQRVAIARALAGRPQLLVADEPTTALDATVQSEILELLADLKEQRQMSLVLVSHDFRVIGQMADRVAVMYSGQIVETGTQDQVMSNPSHPYTASLLAADPHNATLATMLPTIPGVVPDLGMWPTGCRFNPRCGFVEEKCHRGPIPLLDAGRGRLVRCVRADGVQSADLANDISER